MFNSTSFGSVIIHGHFINLKIKSNQCYYNCPIDGFSNILYNDIPLHLKNDSTFYIETSIKKSGYIFIRIPGKLLRIFVTPSDTLDLIISYTKISGGEQAIVSSIKVLGKNALGHEQLCLKTDLNDQQNYLLSTTFSKRYTSVNALFQESKVDLEKLLTPFDSLWVMSKIDSNYHSIVTADIKSTFEYNLFNLFEYLCNSKDASFPNNEKFGLINSAKKNNRILFTNQNFDSLRRMCYNYIYPLNELFSYSFIGGGYYSKYCNDLYNGFINPVAISYDSSFLRLDSSYRYLGFLKKRLLEVQFASSISYDAMRKSDPQQLETSFNLFKAYFPASGYIPYLKQKFLFLKKDNSLTKVVSREFTIVDKQHYTSLMKLIHEKFNNQYVFVDLWATWCKPCVEEFSNKNELKLFLDKKHIKILYVSIDDNSTVPSWRNFIVTKKLYGFHSNASEQMRRDIQKLLYNDNTIAIPRYFFINKQGNIINSDLPRPDNIQKLEYKITQLIDTTE